ncbi:MAG: hypothetical protein H6513_14045 [Acidimicrobiaceae bacterium]|nr:hypothetical protein [Ilumatobacter sp.]MCB9381806.1 hypothetical protein [Acidimicrobiaceae bacterium]
MPGNPFTDPNWATDLADTVERVVGKVRSVATDNAVKASRGIVFGMLGLLALLTATPLFIILITRLSQTVLSRVIRTDHATTVWASYLIVGGVLMIGGFLLLRMRHSKEAS